MAPQWPLLPGFHTLVSFLKNRSVWPAAYSPSNGMLLPKLDCQKTMASGLSTLSSSQISVTHFKEDQMPCYGNATWELRPPVNRAPWVKACWKTAWVSLEADLPGPFEPNGRHSLKRQLRYFWILDIQELGGRNCAFFHAGKFWSNLFCSNMQLIQISNNIITPLSESLYTWLWLYQFASITDANECSWSNDVITSCLFITWILYQGTANYDSNHTYHLCL